MYLERIKQITDWEYCNLEPCKEAENLYRFGFEDGFHFYLSEYYVRDSLGRWYLNCFLNKKQYCAIFMEYFNEVDLEIKKILKQNAK